MTFAVKQPIVCCGHGTNNRTDGQTRTTASLTFFPTLAAGRNKIIISSFRSLRSMPEYRIQQFNSQA